MEIVSHFEKAVNTICGSVRTRTEMSLTLYARVMSDTPDCNQDTSYAMQPTDSSLLPVPHTNQADLPRPSLSGAAPHQKVYRAPPSANEIEQRMLRQAAARYQDIAEIAPDYRGLLIQVFA